MRSPADASVSADTATPGPEPGVLLSVPDMLGRLRGSSREEAFRLAAGSINSQTTQTLIARIATTDDPLKLWALHLALDRRNVPPCLRWPANDTTPQDEFITLLADLLWFTQRNPTHRAAFKGWCDLLKLSPESAPWHAAALRQYLWASRRASSAHWYATGLDLDDDQRQELMAMPTNSMRASRRQLEPRAFRALRESLELHAQARPDRSGATAPLDVAERRARIWRTYVLAGRSPSRAAAYWRLITGETITRQALSKQVAIVEDAIRRERPGRAIA